MKRVFYHYFVIILILFSSGRCILSNLFECKSSDCRGKSDRLLMFAGLFQASSCALNAVGSSGGTQDDENMYKSFTGRIADTEWNSTYIRKSLHTFAYGGPASDAQIDEWVKMGPAKAIIKILNADPVNSGLNVPADGKSGAVSANSSVYCLSSSLANGGSVFPSGNANRLSLTDTESTGKVYSIMVMLRGLNPVRHVLGFMESNNHLSTNAKLVGPKPQARLYDETMNLIAAGNSYDKVLSNASVSPAIAIQYNHRKNVFKNAAFSGNEDFAREFHQLFFGVLGTGTTTGDITQSTASFQTHETVTVPETAKALTDIRVGGLSSSDDMNLDTAVYATEYHLDRAVKIYGSDVTGANAKEKIANASKLAIANAESLNNLPLKIIRFLADDNLDENDITAAAPTAAQTLIQSKAALIRTIWKDISDKNLLMFLRRYALSTAFSNSTRIKYRTSAERIFTISNLVTLTNAEISYGMNLPYSPLLSEDVTPFTPNHEVFGTQTGIEARDTSDVFKMAYNGSTETPDLWGSAFKKDSSNSIVYRKPFDLIIPKGSDGKWRVKQVAEWLWNRFIGDGNLNMGNLERAHLYALLGSGYDLNYFMAKDKKDTTINSTSYGYGDSGTNDIALSTDLKTKIDDAGVAVMTLDDPGTKGDEAKTRVGLAIDFIIALPFMFVQEGK